MGVVSCKTRRVSVEGGLVGHGEAPPEVRPPERRLTCFHLPQTSTRWWGGAPWSDLCVGVPVLDDSREMNGVCVRGGGLLLFEVAVAFGSRSR